MGFIKFLIILLVAAVGAGLATINVAPVRFDYYLDAVEAPLALVLAGALGVGVLLGLLVSLGMVFGLRRENAQMRRKLEKIRLEPGGVSALPHREP